MATSLSDRSTRSGPRNPCPICGRVKDSSCEIKPDLVFCHRGQTNKPPADLKPGDVLNGWAYVGESEMGRAMFKPDEPKASGRRPRHLRPLPQPPAAVPIVGPITLARLPDPLPPQPPDHRPNGHVFEHGDGRSVRLVRTSTGKDYYPSPRQAEVPGTWAHYREAEALTHGRGLWVVEAEGENCCDIIRAGGLVAVSHPGHQRSHKLMVERYQRLVAGGIVGIFRLDDNDQHGREEGLSAAAAANEAGLRFQQINALAVWPGIPEKGSIDDVPGTPAERVAAIEAAVPQALPRAQRTEPETVRGRLTAAIADGASEADLAELVSRLATETGESSQAIQRQVEALTRQHQQRESVNAEKASIRAEADRRDIGRALTLDYLLPPPIAEALRVRSKALPVDDVAAAVTFLVAVSGLVKLGTRVVASQSADYRVPINLYAALVARSGAKKSPVSRLLVNAPSAELRQELAREHHRATEEWKASNKGAKTADRTDPPKAAYLQVSDATAEALAAQLQQQEARGLGMLLHRDELAGLFGSLNQYRGGHGADEELFLEAFDGSGLHSLRIATAGGGRFYNRCHLSIWGTIQPAVLTELVAGGDASGLWARFVFVPLPERVVPLGNDTKAEQRASIAASATLADAARSIYTLPKTEHPLSPEAFASFSRYEARCQGEALRAVIPAQSALYGKAAGKVLRIAGLLHLLGKVTGKADAEISPGTIDRAVALVDHLNGWALSLHADIANGGASDLMRKIHKIAEAANKSIQWRDVSVRLTPSQRKGKEIDSDAFAAAVDALADLEVGEVTRSERGKPVYRALHPLP